MLQTYKLEKIQPVSHGPQKEIAFYRKMYLKMNKVHSLIDSNFAKFAESAMERTNSVLQKVNVPLKVIY